MTDRHEAQLISEWIRHDWRESMFAPGVAIFQAMTRSGRTASGLGFTRQDALDRCLSETAEIIAIAELREAGGFDPRDGLAAHPNRDLARAQALSEAHERRVVSQWWLGEAAAERLPDDWLEANGIQPLLQQAREHAAVKRRTGFWRLVYAEQVHVVIGMSSYPSGQDPILGFGASARLSEATEKALRETLLMEMNLVEVLAARSGHSRMDMSRVETKIASYARRCPNLLGATEPASTRLLDVDFGATVSSNPSAHYQKIGPEELDRSVWMCRLGHKAASDPKDIGSPFM